MLCIAMNLATFCLFAWQTFLFTFYPLCVVAFFFLEMGASCSSDARTSSTARSRARSTAKARRGTITSSLDDPRTFNRKPHSPSAVQRRASRGAQNPPMSNKEDHVTPCRSSQVHDENAVVENRATLEDCTADDTRGALYSNAATNPLVLPVVHELYTAAVYDGAGNVGAGEVAIFLAPPTSEAAPFPLQALGRSSGPLRNCDLVPRDVSSPLISRVDADAAATRRRLSIMAPSAADSELQQASTYSSLTSPLANLIRVHDCFSSSQNPSKGSVASAALTSLANDVRDANASPSRLVQHTHSLQFLPPPRRSSPVFRQEQLPPTASREMQPAVPDASASHSVSSQLQEVLMFDVPEVHSTVDALPVDLRASNLMPSPLKEGVVASRRGNTDGRGAVSPQRGGAGVVLLRGGGPRRSVVASPSPSQFSPLRKSFLGSEATIVEMLKNLEHLSNFDLKGLVQQCRRSGIFRVFDAPLSNPKYNQFVADTLSSLCMTRMQMLRAAISLGLVGTPDSKDDQPYESISLLMPSDRKVVADMISSNAINHALNDLHEILLDEEYAVGRTLDDRRSVKVDAMTQAADHLSRRLPFVNAAWEEYKGALVHRIASAAVWGSTTMADRHVPDEVLPGIFVGSYHAVLSDDLMAAHRIEAVVSCVGDLFQHSRHVDDRADYSDLHTTSSLMTMSRTTGANGNGGRSGSPRRRSMMSDGVSTCSSVTSVTALARLAGGEVDTLDDDEVETDEVSYSTHNGVEYCNFELRDRATFRIDKCFAVVNDFVREQYLVRGRRVLIVCGVGVSRAPTVCAACLCELFGLTPAAALRLIKAVRPQAKPNDAFLLHLLRCYSPHSLPR
jgi:hypothetical protein